MNSDTERELKILLTRDQYEQIRKAIQFDSERIQTNIYYDHPDQAMLQKMTALRIRTIGNTHMMTIKQPKDAITKYEYEHKIHTCHIKDLNQPEKQWIMDHGLNPEGLEPTVKFTTQRCILTLPQAELSLDKNTFAHSVDYELEYEYRQDHDGVAALNSFLKPFGLSYEKNCPGKYARALKDQS